LKNIVSFSPRSLAIIKKQIQVITDHTERLEELATTPEGLDLLV
jgi:hypothetical protein